MAYRMTKTERIARERMGYQMWLIAREGDPFEEDLRAKVPQAWHLLEQDVDCEEPKEKVTLYLDRSVVRMFKAMGKGYQARINRLLQSWLQMKIANLLEVEEQIDARYWAVSRKIVEARKAGEAAPHIADDASDWPKEDAGEW